MTKVQSGIGSRSRLPSINSVLIFVPINNAMSGNFVATALTNIGYHPSAEQPRDISPKGQSYPNHFSAMSTPHSHAGGGTATSSDRAGYNPLESSFCATGNSTFFD